MNCKPGDLAVFVRSYCGNEGKIVRCIRLVDWPPRYGYESVESVWETDRPVRDTWGETTFMALDSYLRPIRPQPDDAVDEMVQKLGKPEEVTA